jgi:hypothetical protein
LLTGAADIAHAQVQEPLALQRLGGAIRLDGNLDDAAWQEIESLPVVTHVPTFNHAPSNQTEVRVAYDVEGNDRRIAGGSAELDSRVGEQHVSK